MLLRPDQANDNASTRPTFEMSCRTKPSPLIQSWLEVATRGSKELNGAWKRGPQGCELALRRIGW
jgi:hypothetical protein